MIRGPLAVAAAIAALVPAACGGADSGPADGATLRVYVSLPLSGPAADDGRDAADGAALALAEQGREVAGYAIEAEILNASDGPQGWTPAQAGANARKTVRDSTAVAYLGDFESGATRASLPITNAARILQVSPASGAGDLVAPLPGGDDVPDVQHTGQRTFGRVIPSDAALKSATTAWSRELGIADRWSPSDDAYGELRHETGDYTTLSALDPSLLPPAGQEFVSAFDEEYGRPPGPWAAYGYEAMAVILDALERATDPADRQTVTEAFFDTSSRDSILGPYSITETGETTLGRVSGYDARGGREISASELVVP